MNCLTIRDMIGHAAKGVDAMLVAYDPLLKQQVEQLVVLDGKEHRLPPIATKHARVEPARDVDAWLTCHSSTIPSRIKITLLSRADPISYFDITKILGRRRERTGPHQYAHCTLTGVT
jgi:hypothetical protein